MADDIDEPFECVVTTVSGEKVVVEGVWFMRLNNEHNALALMDEDDECIVALFAPGSWIWVMRRPQRQPEDSTEGIGQIIAKYGSDAKQEPS